MLQGKADGYAGMNGVELINSLEDTEQRFLEWFYHTQFEMSYGIVEHFLKKTPAELTYLSRLEKDKEEIFRSDGNRKKEMECSPEYALFQYSIGRRWNAGMESGCLSGVGR